MKKILIIDDEEKIRSLLARMISMEGFDVLQAAALKSGMQTLEQIDMSVLLRGQAGQ